MKFVKIQPYGDTAYTYWICGIYKICEYSNHRGEYTAFFIQPYASNWGDYVSRPPHYGRDGHRCWDSFKGAEKACIEHAKKHTPSEGIIARALEIQEQLIAQAKRYDAELERRRNR